MYKMVKKINFRTHFRTLTENLAEKSKFIGKLSEIKNAETLVNLALRRCTPGGT